jgi:hypothetical protein
MNMQEPEIEKRTYDQIVARAEDLAKTYTSWSPDHNGQLDPGGALIRIFARMAELVIERLNKVPDKNFLAFLDLIGTEQRPPQPARALLSFRLATGSPGDILVRAGTQAAAPPVDESGEILFETDDDLLLTLSQMTGVYVREPQTDRFANDTKRAKGVIDAAFPAFKGDQQIEHILYLAHDAYFALQGIETATLIFYSPDADKLAALPISWAYWDEEANDWRELTTQSSSASGNSLQIVFSAMPPLTPKAIDGVEAGWIRAKLNIALPRDAVEIVQNDPAKLTIYRQDLGPDAIIIGETVLENLNAPFSPFGQSGTPAAFYLKIQEAWEKPDAEITLDLNFEQAGTTNGNPALFWQYSAANQGWQQLGRSRYNRKSSGVATFDFSDNTMAMTRNGLVTFRCPLDWQPHTLFGVSGYWLLVEISSGEYGSSSDLQRPVISRLRAGYAWQLPRIERIEALVNFVNSGLAPDKGFGNDLAVDLEKDFYPFGEKPRFNDAFSLTSKEVFSRPGAQVTVDVNVSDPAPVAVNPSPDLEVAWEAWNGTTWQELAPDPPNAATTTSARGAKGATTIEVVSTAGLEPGAEIRLDPGGENQEDHTISHIADDEITLAGTLANDHAQPTNILRLSPTNFTHSGTIGFSLPDKVEETDVNGEPGFWVRVRIKKGDYGKEAYFKLKPDRDDQKRQILDLIEATFGPPSLAKMTLGYNYSKPASAVSVCKTYNDFTYTEQTKTAGESGSHFLPFTPVSDARPALYLGFDRPFSNRPNTLYFNVEAALYDEETVTGLADSKPAKVEWEYSGPGGWKPLGAQDETRALAARGLVNFIGPPDFAARTEFGKAAYWLRLRWHEGDFPVPPHVRRILTNTTWASQAVTIRNEILGSGNGNPNQTFRTAKTPVLQGIRIEVRERDLPSQPEREAIEMLEGPDAVREAEEPGQVWVRWHQVTDFHGSGARDRHYIFDYLGGELRFGDGRRGMAAPQGRNNIRAAMYRSGGGRRGNLPAETITQLKSTIPYVDGVTHYEPSGGGANAESLESVKERGPRALRHRERAVTVQDFEDLAHEASPNVARAKTITPQFNPIEIWEDLPTNGSPPKEIDVSEIETAGRVGLIIVPQSTNPQPQPSLDLIGKIEKYILDRCTSTLELWIAGPDWRKVSVTAEIVPVSVTAAEMLKEKVIAALQRFLHPLPGGMDARGWEFGRSPHRSDLYALIEKISGVDHVRYLEIIEEDIEGTRPDRFLVYSGTHNISFVSPI